MTNQKIIESFLKDECTSFFYDGDYNLLLKDIKDHFLEMECIGEDIIDNKVVFCDDDENDVKYNENNLAYWYRNNCTLPLGFPSPTDLQYQRWYDKLVKIFKKNKLLLDAIDDEIRKI